MNANEYTNNITMEGYQALSARLGWIYASFPSTGERYKLVQVINITVNFEKSKTEVPILGRTGPGHKAAGWSGSGSMNLHYNTSIFRKYFEHYKNTGEDVYLELQITNYDPTSGTGRQTCVVTGVNLDGGVLAALDASGDYLTDDISFTFDDFHFPETFTMLDGMQA